MGFFDALTNMTPEQNQGLLAAAASILQGAGNPRAPFGFGQALGAGITGFQQGTQDAQDRAYQQQVRGLQMEDARMNADERKRKRQLEQQIQAAALASVRDPGQMALMGGGGPTQANADAMQGMQPGFDEQAFINRVQAIDPLRAQDFIRQFAKAAPEFDTTPQIVNDENGKPVLVQLSKTAAPRVLQGLKPREKLELRNLGGFDEAVNLADLKPGQRFQRTITPGESARLAQDERQFNARNAPGASALKPLPASALKMQQSELDALSTASGIQSDLARVQNQLETGKLSFGPISNLINQGRNLAGVSNEESRNFASFKSTLEKLRNDSLRLNAGVQTDGDAQRAWNELFANITDKGVVEQRLREIQGINARAAQLRKLNIDGIRANYGYEPLDTSAYEKAAGTQPARPRADGGTKTISLADIAETARRSGRTTAEVTAAARAKGYKIEGN